MPRHGGNLNHPRLHACHLAADTINEAPNPYKVPGLSLQQARIILRQRDASMTALSELGSKLKAANIEPHVLQRAARCGWFIARTPPPWLTTST